MRSSRFTDDSQEHGIEVFDLKNGTGRVLFSAISQKADTVFRDDYDIQPVYVNDSLSYIPWGADNRMPFDIMDLVDADETVSTCMDVSTESLFASGVDLVADGAAADVADAVDEFELSVDLQSYWLGLSRDFTQFGFAVSVITLDKAHSSIKLVSRKEACYCRFSKADRSGRPRFLLYANWRKNVAPEEIDIIPLLDPRSPWRDLRDRRNAGRLEDRYAVVSRIPTVDSTYYPIPSYGALFRGKWYRIKQLIGIAKEAKLKNAAPIKYHVEIADAYWDRLVKREGISDNREKRKRIARAKQEIVDFLTGAENSGKALFSSFRQQMDSRVEFHEVHITKIDSAKEGGDWETDIQEAINMICFAMRVHSNLVGSVPGKSQSNNSGSDKRELYTISQCQKTPYRRIMLTVLRLIIAFNRWNGVKIDAPILQLTTLDEHRDVKKADTQQP